MKTFIALILMTLVQLNSGLARAYILPLDIILQKSAQLAGNSIVNIDQDVQIKDGNKTYTIKESWLIEGDRNLKLSAHGVGELKDSININYLYNNKSRVSFIGHNKMTKTLGGDLFEKYLAIKSKDSYSSYLKELNIAPSVRLSRAGGLVCFAIGTESAAGNVNPQMWIDQNSFRLTKIRLPSNAEVEFTDYTEKDGVHYPRQKVISWDGKTVKITVTKITTKTGATIKNFYPEALDSSLPLSFANAGVTGAALEEFYSRFR
ncbi:MAG: hypothetical protein ACXWQQ_05970 [Pseudobdellovibrio sp.]